MSCSPSGATPNRRPDPERPTKATKKATKKPAKKSTKKAAPKKATGTAKRAAVAEGAKSNAALIAAAHAED